MALVTPLEACGDTVQDGGMRIDVRQPGEDGYERWVRVAEIPFGEEATDADIARIRKTLPVDRALAAFDGDDMIGVAGAYPLTFTVPGTTIPAGGVTMVGVLPSHRRRGVLTALMRDQLSDLRERGEGIAVLWASESLIYPRFGYGLASWHGSIEIEKDRARFVGDPPPEGRVRMVSLSDAMKALPPIYDYVARERPGMLGRTTDWWETRRLADPPEHRDGYGPAFCAIWEEAGEAEAYALYRTKGSWHEGFPDGKVQVIEALSTTSTGTREIWRFLFGIDLTTRVHAAFLPVDHPLLHMLTQPDRLRFRMGAALWVRIVEVREALQGRRYTRDGSFTFGLEDAFCPWNEGTWRLTVEDGSATVERSRDEPDLRLGAVELGSVYLGGLRILEHARAGRIRGADERTLALADEIFRWHTAPWCPEIF